MVRPAIIERQNAISKTPMLDRIAAMKESLAAAGDEAQQLRHLPAWASKAMADQGLYRYALPLELGGENLRAREQIEIIEAVSAIDGSVGWCTQISSEINALVIRRMEPAFAHQIFDEWDALVCSGHGPANGPSPGRKARRDGAGWRLNYQGSFASGCHNANWNFLMGAMTVDESTGKPAEASFMVPRGEFEIVDTWDTAGMRGSGSHDVRMADCYVSARTPPSLSIVGAERDLGQPDLPEPDARHLQQSGGRTRGLSGCYRLLYRTRANENAVGIRLDAQGPGSGPVSHW